MKLAHILTLSCCLALPLTQRPLEAGFIQSIKESIWGCEAPAPMIKVLIAYDQPKVKVELKGSYRLYNPHTEEFLSTRFFSKCQAFEAICSGLKWGEEFPGIYQLQVIPEEGTLLLVDGQAYHGILYVYAIEDSIHIVNEVSLEHYLESILSTVNQNLPAEALAAIAIAARTDAHYTSEHPKSRFWAVDASKVGYRGRGRPHVVTPVEKAIHATRYMLMSRTSAYEKVLTPFPAQWHVKVEDPAASKQAIMAQLTLAEVEVRAKKGENAAQILAKAFPNTTIAISYP